MTEQLFLQDEPAAAEAPRERPARPLQPQPIGAVNWLGIWTLYAKEVQRFLKVGVQSVLAPVVTTLLFLAIFTLAIGPRGQAVATASFGAFLAPGLIMMAIIQNSFANTSSSLLISKIQGNIVDVLMPPLMPAELTLCYALSGATRGIIVALAVGVSMLFFVDLQVAHAWAVVFYAPAASLLLSLLGVIAGIWAEKFDHMAAVTNFVIMPLAFLSGTFYSVERLPGIWYAVSHANPFFYMIDGFRYGFIGHADGSLAVGVGLLVGLNLALWFICHRLFARGWRLKA